MLYPNKNRLFFITAAILIFVLPGCRHDTEPSITADTTRGPAPLHVSFTAGPADSSVTYSWDFGDNSDTASGMQVTHTFSNEGWYAVTLTTTDGRGRSSTATIDIRATPRVPDSYQALYSELEGHLNTFAAQQASTASDNASAPQFTTEMIVAGGNRGETLLDPLTLTATEVFLDRYAELGWSVASIQVSYPLLLTDFPRSSEYLEFYKSVIKLVRERNMLVFIETSPVFSGTSYSDVEVDYSGKSIETYFDERKQQIRIIAEELAPDYLSIGHEPATEEWLTGFGFTVDEYLAFVTGALSELDRSGGMKVGAGTGSWEDGDYIKRFAEETDLDFINIHIYPVAAVGGVSLLEQAETLAGIARTNNKSAVIGECWLYKTPAAELTRTASKEEVFRRDVYSFWEPLDVLFMKTVAALAREYDIRIVNFFWAQYFFAQLIYDTSYESLAVAELMKEVNAPAWQNIEAGVLSELGKAYLNILSE